MITNIFNRWKKWWEWFSGLFSKKDKRDEKRRRLIFITWCIVIILIIGGATGAIIYALTRKNKFAPPNDNPTHVVINNEQTINGEYGCPGFYEYSAYDNIGNKLTDHCEWSIENATCANVNIDNSGKLEWLDTATSGTFDLRCHHGELTDGVLVGISLNINSSYPGSSTPTYISMSECVTEIIGIKDSQLTSTSEITTTDDNGDFVSVSYAIVDGALPSGLSINSSNGVIYGTPTSIGNTTFKIQASGLIGSKWYRLTSLSSTISCEIKKPNPTQLLMSGIPSFIDEKQYIRMKDTNQITTTDNNGDVATVMYSIIGSTPPQGLQIDEITGIISGTPTSSGAGVLTIKATGTTDNWNGLECYSDIGYNIEPSSAKSIALFGETELLIPFKTSYTYTSSIAEAIITTSGLPSGFVFDGHTLTTPESVTNAGKFNLTATFGNLTCTKEISYFPSSGFENNRLILIEGSINNFTFEPIPIIISDGVMQPPSITASQKDLTIGIYFTNFDEEVNVISDGFLSGFNKLVNIDISKLCNVTSIGNNFCNGCRKLSSIDLSPLSNVQTIGSYFLTGCSSLTNVNLDALSHIDNVMDNFLEGCSKLVSINLNPLSNVTNIANNFLRNCSSLTNIDLSSLTNLRVIGNDFLNSCKNIRSVNFNNQSNINSVGDGFLYICSNLISFDLHPLHNIQNIGANFLYRCTKLNSVDLSPLSNVTTIGECFLLGCIGLTDLDLSPLTGLSTIKSRFLEECTRLISVNLSSLNVLSTIQNNFFYSCNGLRYINIGNVDWSNINPNASNAFNSVTNISSNVIFGQYANEFKSKFSNINNWTAITQ